MKKHYEGDCHTPQTVDPENPLSPAFVSFHAAIPFGYPPKDPPNTTGAWHHTGIFGQTRHSPRGPVLRHDTQVH